ncbi:MAG: A24 family peptidase [Polyangiaceae bacterium]
MVFLLTANLVALLAAIQDFRSGQISNRITYATLLLSPPLHALVARQIGGDLRQCAIAAGVSLLGALLCGLLPFLLWLKGVCGGGDVKLFAALGAVLEPFMGLEAQVYAYYVAALTVPLGLLYRGTFWRTLKSSWTLLVNSFRPTSKRVALEPSKTWFRLGPAIWGGCLLTAWMHWRG